VGQPKAFQKTIDFYLKSLFLSMRFFYKRRGATLAAASSFYILLTIIPFFLFIIKVLSFMFGEEGDIELLFTTFITSFFPDLGTELISQIKGLITSPLHFHAGLTFSNFCILVFSSLLFLNSIWNGLYIMTSDPVHKKWKKHLKGIGILTLTVLFFSIFVAGPPLIEHMQILMNNSDVFNELREKYKILNWLVSDTWRIFFFRSGLVKFLFFWIFFSFIYKWFFGHNLNLRESSLGALIFSVCFILGKSLFWVYLDYTKLSYGIGHSNYYVFLVGLLWPFLNMCLFFWGASFCHVIHVESIKWVSSIEDLKKKEENVDTAGD